ncbi:hypothetical protein G4228_015285 [Cervus hanglu yarkandensis]|nr:hypothetical protein G4228_015285 [Cervus hanglu yarkandensis]
MRRLCLSAALLFLLVILVDSIPVNIHHIQDEGLETSHTRELEKRSVVNVVKSTKIVGNGASILTGLAEIINKALKGQVMISGIQFDNHTQEELATLEIEYSTLSEEIKGVETSHKQGLEKRSVLPVVKGILGGVLKGQVMISGIQFDNHTQEELPTLQIEYSTLSEESKGVETSHKRVLEKRSVVHVVKSILGGVIKGQVMISGIQFDNHTQEEFPTLNMEYSTLSEEMKVSPTSMPAFCLEPKVTGGCNTMMTRYFYNAQTGLCEQFVYGGCEGNANNFEKLEDCMKTCSQEAGSLCLLSFIGQVVISRAQLDNHTVEEFPTLISQYSTLNEDNKASKPTFCLEPKLTGDCNAVMTRYVYNAQPDSVSSLCMVAAKAKREENEELVPKLRSYGRIDREGEKRRNWVDTVFFQGCLMFTQGDRSPVGDTG